MVAQTHLGRGWTGRLCLLLMAGTANRKSIFRQLVDAGAIPTPRQLCKCKPDCSPWCAGVSAWLRCVDLLMRTQSHVYCVHTIHTCRGMEYVVYPPSQANTLVLARPVSPMPCHRRLIRSPFPNPTAISISLVPDSGDCVCLRLSAFERIGKVCGPCRGKRECRWGLSTTVLEVRSLS